MQKKRMTATQFLEFVIDEFSLEATYQFFFKTGLMFATLAVLTSSTAVTILLPYEKEYTKDKFAFESKIPVQSWQTLDCTKIVDAPLQADCKLVQYEQKNMQSILNATDKLYQTSIFLSVLFFALTAVGYFFNASKRINRKT